MAAGGGRPRCGLDICCVEGFAAGNGGNDLFVADSGGNDDPVDTTAGEKRDVEGGVGGE